VPSQVKPNQAEPSTAREIQRLTDRPTDRQTDRERERENQTHRCTDRADEKGSCEESGSSPAGEPEHTSVNPNMRRWTGAECKRRGGSQRAATSAVVVVVGGVQSCASTRLDGAILLRYMMERRCRIESME
jgi:hypothetical protein